MAEGRVVDDWIPMADGVRLAVTLYLPDESVGPQPCVLEALPYRKDDLTVTYRPEYTRLRDEHSYAVARLDVRGTGSSGGRATDEYPAQEQADLVEVIAWLARQPWCDGNVGMYGTSYSGFNSIQLACERPPALKAIVAIYATDDRYTDDVHYMGGARKWLDLVDYCHYMTPMNALPPVPELWGDGWYDEWLQRIDEHEPWLLTWLEHQRDDAYWRHGSLRPDYDRIECAVMVVAGWADGYRNNSFRTMAALREAGVPHRLLAGPWSHAATSTSAPGPRIDLLPEMVAWWDRWLRGRDVPMEGTCQWYVREACPPAPDLDTVPGTWRTDVWPSAQVSTDVRPLSPHPSYDVRADVGTAAWISCAGHLPYGQPLDQRHDDADSMTWEWESQGEEIAGYPVASLTVASSEPVAFVSAKLCEVLADGSSVLVTRGFLNLTRRHGMSVVAPMPVGEPVEVDVELEATAWRFSPGTRLRLSIAGADWPNTAAPPRPLTLTVSGGSLSLPVVTGPSGLTSPSFVDGDEASGEELDGVVWKVERDVLGRETACVVDHGSTYETRWGKATEHYFGRVAVDTRTFEQTAESDVSFTLHMAETAVTSAATLRVVADETAYDVDIRLTCSRDGEVVRARSWQQRFDRDLA